MVNLLLQISDKSTLKLKDILKTKLSINRFSFYQAVIDVYTESYAVPYLLLLCIITFI